MTEARAEREGPDLLAALPASPLACAPRRLAFIMGGWGGRGCGGGGGGGSAPFKCFPLLIILCV